MRVLQTCVACLLLLFAATWLRAEGLPSDIRIVVPVAQAYISGLVLVAHPSLGVASVKELVALARKLHLTPE